MTTTYCPRCLLVKDPELPFLFHLCTPHPAAEELRTLKELNEANYNNSERLRAEVLGNSEQLGRLTSENEDMFQQLRKEQLSVQKFADENARLEKDAARLREAIKRLLVHADDEYYGQAAAAAKEAIMEVGK